MVQRAKRLKMYAHAIHPHTEEQLEAATQMLKEKHEKRVGPRGERVATKIVQNLRKDDGAFNSRRGKREAKIAVNDQSGVTNDPIEMEHGRVL